MDGFPPPYSLPWDLHPLLPGGDGTGRTLPVALQPGRLVVSDKGAGEPAFWLSDGPADYFLWKRLLAEHEQTGFWPLLLGLDGEGDPWATGEVSFEGVTSPADHDPEAVLQEWWYRYVVPGPVDTAPFGAHWPAGRAPATLQRSDPGRHAETFGATLLYDDPSRWRLGLVAASSADSVAAIGWREVANHTTDIAEISAVLRDWERRYGTRVVAIDDGSLHLSVSAPPGKRDEALRVAAEHYAFCPEDTWSTTVALINNEIVPCSGTVLAEYAETLINNKFWIFHWY
ncbi:DUF4253 domain-containing protein [Nocardia sp. NPDC050630]|uniref:DUF4253 domain-containing protein n=1 Tax=Nocardia sp. NPDC050630 TaxID=3364321 RepID=UPI0037AC4523